MTASTDELNELIKAGRGTRLDWLGEGAKVEAIATILTAMANTDGGTLVIGVLGPAGVVIGVKDVEAVKDRVMQAALSSEPSLYIPLPKQVQLQERKVIVVSVPRGMPHVYAFDGRFLARQGAENVPLKPHDLRRLMVERGEISFETEIARGASLDDIDWDKARIYAARVGAAHENREGIQKLLQRRGCLVLQEERLRPTNAGILLFGKDPQRYIRAAEVTVTRFSGNSMTDEHKRLDIGGTLPDQIARVEDYLRSNLVKEVQLGQTMTRAEEYEYPLEAARELVVNAVAHRDYSVGGDTVHLRLFHNRMEVTSPGGLPGPMTVDNIKDERFSRNPVIVQVLSDLGYIERLGYGVDRVIDLMRERRLRDPVFEETAGGFRVTLFNQARETALKAVEAPKITFNGEYRGQPINPRQEQALIYLTSGNSRITNGDLQALCPDVHAETLRRDLADLVSKQILRKLGEKRGSYYVLHQE